MLEAAGLVLGKEAMNRQPDTSGYSSRLSGATYLDIQGITKRKTKTGAHGRKQADDAVEAVNTVTFLQGS